MPPHLTANGELPTSPSGSQLTPASTCKIQQPETPRGLEATQGDPSSANQWTNYPPLSMKFDHTHSWCNIGNVWGNTRESKSLPQTPPTPGSCHVASRGLHQRCRPTTSLRAVQISKAGNCCKEEGCCLSKCTWVIYFDKCSLVLIIDNSSEQSVFG